MKGHTIKGDDGADLLQRPGRVYTRDELLDRVWGLGFSGESNVLEATGRRYRDVVCDGPPLPQCRGGALRGGQVLTGCGDRRSGGEALC